MEVPMSPPLLGILLTSVIVGIVVAEFIRRKTNGSGSKSVDSPLPPGRTGYPLIGETLSMIAAYKTEHPDNFIADRVRSHGSAVFLTHVFGERTIFSADPDVNKFILQSEGKEFVCSYPSTVATLLGKHSLVVTGGAYHRRLHSLTLSSFSNTPLLRDLLLPGIDRAVRRNLGSWRSGSVVVLMDQAKKITFELAVMQLMSVGPGKWTEDLRREYQILIDGFFSVPVPFKIPFTAYGRALTARAKVARQISSLVRERIAENREGEDVNGKKKGDVLDRLLAEGVKEEDEVVDFLLALLVAGYETTPTAMTLAVKFLTENPAALALIRDEHDKIQERKGKGTSGTAEIVDEADDGDAVFEWSDYKTAMPFTHCVINETLRVANIVSGVFRRATTDVQIKGYTIPKGCKVFASFRAVHMDDDRFEDAQTFNPWRWQQKDKQQNQQCEQQEDVKEEKKKKMSSASYCVFGGGPRICPGYEVARVQLCVFFHYLLTNFSWDAVDEDKLVFYPTTRTLKGYPIRVHRRPLSRLLLDYSPTYNVIS